MQRESMILASSRSFSLLQKVASQSNPDNLAVDRFLPTYQPLMEARRKAFETTKERYESGGE